VNAPQKLDADAFIESVVRYYRERTTPTDVRDDATVYSCFSSLLFEMFSVSLTFV